MSDHPRIRGEHGADRFDGDGLRGSSPHTRGALEPLEWRHEARRIIPAYAGSTSRQSTMKAAMPGSSPHTRGAHPRPCSTMSVRGIIPAYAGSTFRGSGGNVPYADHPRIRGEHVAEIPGKIVKAGSSPHTRGAPEQPSTKSLWFRIIPAYAGSTKTARTTPRSTKDHPRIRGEHPPSPASESAWSGSSPHTRGAQIPRLSRISVFRIIPAYAGSTGSNQTRPLERPDHPRIRGEHPDAERHNPKGNGSSPHTRGAHLEIPAIPRIAAVIIPVFLYPSPTPQEEADRSMVLLTLS